MSIEKIKELLEEYEKRPDFEIQNKISKIYINSYENRKEIEELIEKSVRESKVNENMFWYSFFENNMNFWKKLYLVYEEKIALEKLELVKNNDNKEIFLDIIINFCDISCSNTEEIKGLKEQIEKVWINVFKEFPEFPEKLSKKRKEKEESLKKILEKYSINQPKKEETIKILEMVVPILFKSSKSNLKENIYENLKDNEQYNEFMCERIDYFNNFNLEAYFENKNLSLICNSLKMKVEGSNNIFLVEINKELSDADIKEIEEEILGQLSDGLGTNLARRQILIGEANYSFDFDLEKATSLKEIKNHKKLKM